VTERAETAAPAPPARVADVIRRPAAPLVAAFMGPSEVISLQRTAGNRAVTGLLHPTRRAPGSYTSATAARSRSASAASL
jgi:hypothetical protein